MHSLNNFLSANLYIVYPLVKHFGEKQIDDIRLLYKLLNFLHTSFFYSFIQQILYVNYIVMYQTLSFIIKTGLSSITRGDGAVQVFKNLPLCVIRYVIFNLLFVVKLFGHAPHWKQIPSWIDFMCRFRFLSKVNIFPRISHE